MPTAMFRLLIVAALALSALAAERIGGRDGCVWTGVSATRTDKRRR